MYQPHPVFEAPEPDARLWRYMALEKFIWLLEHRCLYFCRADRLGDPHEGSLSEPARAERAAELEAIGANRPEWQYPAGMQGPEDLLRLQAQSTYVNCWTLAEQESFVLWKLYAGKGVAVRSEFSALCSSLQCEEAVYIGKVHYIDFEHDAIPRGNTFWPLIHKRHYFDAEREVRAVISGNWRDEADTRFQPDPRPGLRISVDAAELVQEISVAPGQPLLADAVAAICRRFDLDRPVRRSLVDTDPGF